MSMDLMAVPAHPSLTSSNLNWPIYELHLLGFHHIVADREDVWFHTYLFIYFLVSGFSSNLTPSVALIS
uniref:Uncharacterized protein n=1 Tax=Arundo donax TaxID=35708 RepID=A0A0A9ADY2_ARUDO